MTELTYEEYLEKNGSMTYSNVGTSMMPLLKQGRDLFTVTKKGSERCRKYDVVLYRRPPDKYVLHRVVKVRKKDYVILGDNCINKEYGIIDDDILGVMTSFVHKGKQHTVNDMTYRIYSHLWVDLSFFRVKLKKLRMKIKRKRK